MVTGDVHIVVEYCLSFFTKALVASVLMDFHIEVVDPHRFLLLEERRQADAKRNSFIRYVFHEVRVPFNSISMGLQLLDGQIPQVEILEMMKDAANYMSETLNDVLTLQKIEEGGMTLELKEVPVFDMVAHVVSLFK
jgi:signal transduction histidine kinase